MELGRRDGLRSNASDVAGNIPEPDFKLSKIISMFAEHNLTKNDVITLSGAHTVGASHCLKFSNRVFNFSSTSKVDPSMDPSYAQNLQKQCTENTDPNYLVVMEPQSPPTFDNKYYQDLVARKGLLASDQALYTDPSTRATVVDYANNQGDLYSAFASAERVGGVL